MLEGINHREEPGSPGRSQGYLRETKKRNSTLSNITSKGYLQIYQFVLSSLVEEATF